MVENFVSYITTKDRYLELLETARVLNGLNDQQPWLYPRTFVSARSKYDQSTGKSLDNVDIFVGSTIPDHGYLHQARDARRQILELAAQNPSVENSDVQRSVEVAVKMAALRCLTGLNESGESRQRSETTEK